MFSLHHLAELPDAVCILFVLEMYLFVPVCVVLLLFGLSVPVIQQKN